MRLMDDRKMRQTHRKKRKLVTKLLRWRGVGMADNVEEKEEEDFVPDGGLLCDQHNTQIEEEVCEFESDNGGNADIRGEAIERDVRLQKRKEMKEQQRKQRADQQVRRDARQRLGREGQEEGEAEFAVVRGEASGEEGQGPRRPAPSTWASCERHARCARGTR